jgi:hypothetical protein
MNLLSTIKTHPYPDMKENAAGATRSLNVISVSSVEEFPQCLACGSGQRGPVCSSFTFHHSETSVTVRSINTSFFGITVGKFHKTHILKGFCLLCIFITTSLRLEDTHSSLGLVCTRTIETHNVWHYSMKYND